MRAQPHRGRSLLAAGVLAALCAQGLLAPAAADANEEAAARILAEAPNGPAATRAAWIYERASRLPDADVAARLLEQMPSRAPQDWLARATLWRVRYWMAADSLGRAAQELARLGDLTGTEPWFAEAACWRELAGYEPPPVSAGRSRSTWEALRRISALGSELHGPPELRAALALEGDARRFGLLGPWIWQLARSESGGLRRAARDAARNAAFELAHAPEAALAIRAAGPVEPAGRTPQEGPRAAPVPGAADTLAPAAIPLPSTPEPAQEGRLIVEVRVLPDEQAARALAAELGRHGFPARMGRAGESAGAPLYRVYLGPCARAAEAESLSTLLQARLFLPSRIVEAP